MPKIKWDGAEVTSNMHRIPDCKSCNHNIFMRLMLY